MTEQKQARKPLSRRGLLAIIAIALVVAILLTSLILALTASPTVYGFGGASLREDAFSYWFSCLKYEYLVHYRDLDIEDTAAGWAKTDEDGRTYGDRFTEMISKEIRMRFIAASLFDSQGYRLTSADYDALDALITDFESESYGEIPFDVLKEDCGVKKKAVKQVALYEQKYEAFYRALFSDTEAIYSESYRDALSEFYKSNYGRYNMIYVKDTVGEERIAALENALFGGVASDRAVAALVTEERFTELEKEYSAEGEGITSGKHPNGIYLYAYKNYEGFFTEELFSAFRLADEAGKVAKVRDADGKGSYYVMRYALDDAPYLSEDERVRAWFDELPSFAGMYLYRSLLEKELHKIETTEVAEGYRVADAYTCKDYNAVRWSH